MEKIANYIKNNVGIVVVILMVVVAIIVVSQYYKQAPSQNTTGNQTEITTEPTTQNENSTSSGNTNTKYLNNPSPVQKGKLSIVTSNLPGGIKGEPYSFEVIAYGDTGVYQWQISNDGLPSGLSGVPSGCENNTFCSKFSISGTPKVSGTYYFTLTFKSVNASVSKSFTLVIKNPPLTFTSETLPIAVVNKQYDAVIAAGGGTGSYHWEVSSLPQSLRSNTSVCVVYPCQIPLTISGVPIVTGTTSITITVTEDGVNKERISRTFDLVVH